jgi:hypothetical protein
MAQPLPIRLLDTICTADFLTDRYRAFGSELHDHMPRSDLCEVADLRLTYTPHTARVRFRFPEDQRIQGVYGLGTADAILDKAVFDKLLDGCSDVVLVGQPGALCKVDVAHGRYLADNAQTELLFLLLSHRSLFIGCGDDHLVLPGRLWSLRVAPRYIRSIMSTFRLASALGALALLLAAPPVAAQSVCAHADEGHACDGGACIPGDCFIATDDGGLPQSVCSLCVPLEAGACQPEAGLNCGGSAECFMNEQILSYPGGTTAEAGTLVGWAYSTGICIDPQTGARVGSSSAGSSGGCNLIAGGAAGASLPLGFIGMGLVLARRRRTRTSPG